MPTEATHQPIDAYAVALDEMDHYQIAPADQRYIEQIRGVYLFDHNQQTHCCELTPSYYLIHLYDQVILTEEGAELDDLIQDRLFQEYEHCGGEDCYVHCSAIEKIIKCNDSRTIYHYGDTEISQQDVGYDEQMESIREKLCENCPF